MKDKFFEYFDKKMNPYNPVNMITIYTTPKCGYCVQCKEWFDEQNIEYNTVDISTDEKAREMIREKTGMMAVPVIQIGNEFILGFDKKRMQELLNK